MRNYAVAVLLLLFLVNVASASQEAMYGFTKLVAEAPMLSKFGPAIVKITQGEAGITSLTVEAFNRSYNASPELLDKLAGYSANGVFLSGEAGFGPNAGALYITLLQGGTHGPFSYKTVIARESGALELRGR